MFEAWGRFVYRWRWATLAVSVLLLGASVFGVLFVGGSVGANGGGLDPSLESARASKLIDQQLPHQVTGGSSFDLIFSTPSLGSTDPAFRTAVEQALQPLRSDPRVTGVLTPYSATNPGTATALTSKDGHAVLAVIDMKDKNTVSETYFPALRAEVKSPTLRVVATGNVPINLAFNTTLESDLQRAEIVGGVLSLVLLLIVFAAVVSALMPLGVGILAVVGGVAGTLLLSRFTDVSQYAFNIVTLIGLGVAIDYSLFVVNRFRDELAGGASREDAVARTMATAGRAITFSGVTVAIGLSGMLLFRGTFLASMGAAGAIVVFLAVFYGLTFLPAILGLLGPRVDALHLGSISRSLLPAGRASTGPGFWHGLAEWVMKRPVLVLVPSAAALLVVALPFAQLRLANGDVDMLPSRLEARQGYDTLLRDFPGQDQTTISVVVYFPGSSPLTADHVGAIYDLSRRVAHLPNVLKVDSLVNLDPALTRADYQRMYGSGSVGSLPADVQPAVKSSIGPNVAVLRVTTNQAGTSDGARAIVRDIRTGPVVGGGGQVLVGGQTAVDIDIISFIQAHVPVAITYVILATLVVLFLLTGSVVLPVKAVVMNLLSVSASFGALVWIFQQGHLSGLLGFTPQSLDPSTPVILFCIVFGLSMDYEVLLVSRIQEEYQKTGDNRSAVAQGLERSGRIITGAAAIMVAVFMAFGLAEVVIIKSIGIGLALAVFIDATVVRVLLVPSVMRLLGRYNWWAPRPLAWMHGRLNLGEVAARSLTAPGAQAS